MNKLFKMLQESFSNPPQRNGFDLSRRRVCSTKVGYKLPVFALETVPNDYHEISPVDIIRTMPFNQANFVRMKQHIDFYWVPMTALQSNFNEVLQQTEDPVNSLLVLPADYRDSLPTFDLLELVFSLLYARLRQLGLSDLEIDSFFSYDSFPESAYYRKLFWDDVPDPAAPAVDMFNQPVFYGTVRLLDQLGYGNYLPFVDFDLQPASDSGRVSLTNVSALWNNFASSNRGKRVNLYRLLAYQAVYQNYGINTTYDKLDIYSYNIDDIVKAGVNRWDYRGNADDLMNLRTIFTLRYSQWKKDIFTASYPDSQFGGVSVVSVNHSVGDSIGTLSANAGHVLGVTTSNYIDGAGKSVAIARTANTAAYSAISSFNVLDLRRAEALQGWKEDMLRSGFRAKMRQKSQFGVSPNFDTHRTPTVLGSISSDIQKDVVTGTSGEEFAEEAATGISTTGGNTIKFDGAERNDFGIIIGILSIIPDADYDSFGIDLHNMKSEPFDFYTPAFANIGLQPMPSQYLNALVVPRSSGTDLIDVLGYVPRYAEYKQAVDTVHGEFCAFDFPALNGDIDFTKEGQFRQFVSSRKDMELWGLSRLASLYVNPEIVDDIFIMDADSELRSDQGNDQFHVNMYFEVKSVRPMSVLGLARWT